MITRRLRTSLRLRNRRGTLLVWFGMTIVLILMVTAVVVDYGYWYMGLTELQTAADAAALRGARRLQMSTKTGAALETDVDTVTVNFSSRNEAQFQGVTIDAAQVQLAYVPVQPDGAGPVQPVFDPAAWPAGISGPNAVVVDNVQNGFRLFGRVFNGLQKPTLGKRAIAWRAYLNAGKCVRPWGMPMSQLTWRISGGIDSSYRTLTGPEITTLNQMSDAQRTFVMVPPEKTVHTDYATLPFTGQWAGIRFNRDATSTGNQGMSEFQRLSAGGCLTSGDAFGVGDYANTDLPAGSLESKMQDAAQNGGAGPSKNEFPPTCVYVNNKANCYANATAKANNVLGSIVNVAYTSAPDKNGSEQVEAYMLGQFKIMCLFTKSTDTCDYNAGSPYPTTGYPTGTIVGMVVADFFTKLTPDIELGNIPSTSSRLLLVR